MRINLDLFKTLTGHNREVNAITFSRDDSLLASAGADRIVRIWNVNTHQVVQTLEHNDPVTYVVFAPSGRMVASAGGDHQARIWNVESGKLLAAIGSPGQSPGALSFTNDGMRLFIGCADGLLRIFNLREKNSESSIRAHSGPVRSLRMSSLGDRLVSSGSDGVARVWQTQATDKPIELKGHTDEVLYATFSPDDRFIATSGQDGTVRLWESESGRQLYSFQAHEGAANSVNFSRDAMFLLSSGTDRFLRCWLADSGHLVSEASGDGRIAEAIFSHAGDRIASCGSDGTVKILEMGAAAAAGKNTTTHQPAVQAPSQPQARVAAGAAIISRAIGDTEANKPLHSVLSRAVWADASDIHVPSGADILFRKHGSLEKLNEPSRTPAEIETMLLDILTEEQRRRFLETNDLDFSYEISGVARFRANVCRQHRGVDGSFRVIPDKIPSPEQLGLPQPVQALTTHHQGLVLITGPAGRGKSTTIASLIDLINSEKPLHIITVEDPIEFVHPIKRAVVNQREVGKHTKSFSNALRAALREDPDVIVVGEMRDLETISLAITAAETGHLVFGSLMTTDASQTVDRILDSFPAGQQAQIRTMLSESLRGICSQQLVPATDGSGRVLACEVLLCNLAVGNMIRERKTFQLGSIMQTGRNLGMQRMDDSLFGLFQAGKITQQNALMFSHDPKAMEPRLRTAGSSPAAAAKPR